MSIERFDVRGRGRERIGQRLGLGTLLDHSVGLKRITYKGSNCPTA